MGGKRRRTPGDWPCLSGCPIHAAEGQQFSHHPAKCLRERQAEWKGILLGNRMPPSSSLLSVSNMPSPLQWPFREPVRRASMESPASAAPAGSSRKAQERAGARCGEKPPWHVPDPHHFTVYRKAGGEGRAQHQKGAA